MSPSGPGGVTYTVTQDVVSSFSSCPLTNSQLTFTVSILNECETTTLSIDLANSYFVDPPSSQETLFAGTNRLMVWNTAGNDLLTNTISFTDPCEPQIIQELYDVTSTAETPLDGVLFTDQIAGING